MHVTDRWQVGSWHCSEVRHNLMQGEFQLSKFQDGVLPAAFMVGLLISSLVYSEMCKHYNAFRLIGKAFDSAPCIS